MQTTQRSRVKSLVFCGLFAALVAVGAFIQIPVPMGDYFTLQFMFVLLAGIVLGPRLGALSVAIYLIIGLAGFPVFAAGGGIGYVLRPSFGYLIGFVLTAFVTGAIVQKISTEKRSQWYYLLAVFAGMFVTYSIGFAYKYAILNFYTGEPTGLWAIVLASLPLDIPGDVALCLVSAAIGPKLSKLYLDNEAA